MANPPEVDSQACWAGQEAHRSARDPQRHLVCGSNRLPWRALPHDFPKWKRVYTVFWRWRKQGVWQRVHDHLRDQVRRSVAKRWTPTAAVIHLYGMISLISRRLTAAKTRFEDML